MGYPHASSSSCRGLADMAVVSTLRLDTRRGRFALRLGLEGCEACFVSVHQRRRLSPVSPIEKHRAGKNARRRSPPRLCERSRVLVLCSKRARIGGDRSYRIADPRYGATAGPTVMKLGALWAGVRCSGFLGVRWYRLPRNRQAMAGGKRSVRSTRGSCPIGRCVTLILEELRRSSGRDAQDSLAPGRHTWSPGADRRLAVMKAGRPAVQLAGIPVGEHRPFLADRSMLGVR